MKSPKAAKTQKKFQLGLKAKRLLLATAILFVLSSVVVVTAVALEGNYTATWDTSKETPGPHTISATAYDAAGNSSTTTITVYVADTTPPVLTVSGVEDGKTYTQPVTPVFSATDNYDASITPTATLNGLTFVSGTTVSAYGSYTLVANAIDKAGNKTTDTRSFVIQEPADITAPTVVITSPRDGSTVSGNVSIQATASDNKGVTKVEFKIDGKLISTDQRLVIKRGTSVRGGNFDKKGVEVRKHLGYRTFSRFVAFDEIKDINLSGSDFALAVMEIMDDEWHTEIRDNYMHSNEE